MPVLSVMHAAVNIRQSCSFCPEKIVCMFYILFFALNIAAVQKVNIKFQKMFIYINRKQVKMLLFMLCFYAEWKKIGLKQFLFNHNVVNRSIFLLNCF